ncbi:MAG: hybrid sensor histidine kinase/response regulator [ANME-2 cluster archaeon]|nr:hybrid sensor histidine kinase/response regulator [ANME-2 cluster archaeon]
MGTKNNEFLKKLQETFKIEAGEHINAISSGLIELEKAQTVEKQMEVIETVFREVHSLKGAARAVNMTDIESVCQNLESVFATLKRKETALSPDLFDVLHQTVDTLNSLLLSAGAKRTASERSMIKELTHRLESEAAGVVQPHKEEEPEKIETEVPAAAQAIEAPQVEKPVFTGTVRVSTAKLDSILLQAEELLSVKQSAGHRSAELREITASFAQWKKEWENIRHDVRSIRRALEKNSEQSIENRPADRQRKINPKVMKNLEFLEWNSTYVKSTEHRLAALHRSCEDDYRLLDKIVEGLLDDMKTVLMLPFSSLLDIFPAFVRKLSRDHGKEVELVIRGEDIKIDKRILDEMKDPLIHLVRNCIDHGIEKPDERVQKNKPLQGTVTIAVSQKNSHQVEILVSDDGAGIDLMEVKSAAVKLGIISKDEAGKLGDQEVQSLIFLSGVSTSPIVTDISGRGLGLSIVGEKVEKLGGTVSLETHPGTGTACRILLPLTLATFRGILICVDEHLFVLPTANVEQVARVNKEQIKTVENRETIRLNGQAVSLVRLADVLKFAQKGTADESANLLQVVVLGSAERRIAFLVDGVLSEQEVLVKKLGAQLTRVPNIVGATILGTGKVVPILNVSDLMKSAVLMEGPGRLPAAPVKKEEIKRKSVLVVEDSITARTLLKNILELAGYDVKTAVDGIDAFTIMKTEDFDLVVSDVDMPRMNGFDLTAKIRRDKELSELPVVLVTALESREDRERGIDAGANAYIIKSSFDQSNLLEVIRRLI